MTKYYGNIGYAETVEISPGYWAPTIVEKPSFGEWIRYASKFQLTADSTNDNKDVASELSIVAADPYVLEHSSDVRYVEHLGKKWKVTAIKPQFPRLILTIGGIWHDGEQAGIADEV